MSEVTKITVQATAPTEAQSVVTDNGKSVAIPLLREAVERSRTCQFVIKAGWVGKWVRIARIEYGANATVFLSGIKNALVPVLQFSFVSVRNGAGKASFLMGIKNNVVGLTKARIVYDTTGTDGLGYLEIYVEGTNAGNAQVRLSFEGHGISVITPEAETSEPEAGLIGPTLDFVSGAVTVGGG